MRDDIGAAAQIVETLRPVRVFGFGAGQLLAALADRGVMVRGRAADGWQASLARADVRDGVEQVPLSAPIEAPAGGFDVVVCLGVLGRVAEPEALAVVAQIAAAGRQVLFDCAGVAQCAAAPRPLVWWLQCWADHGLAPVVGYDAGFAAPGAVLVARAAARPDDAVLAAAADVLGARAGLERTRWAAAEAEQRAGAREQALAAAEARAVRVNHGLEDRLRLAEASLAVARSERDAVLHSTSWRLTAPLRALVNRLPRRARAAVIGQSLAVGLQPGSYAAWVAAHDTLSDADREAIRAHIETLVEPPLISVVMPAYDTPEHHLRAAVASVQAQLYQNWELCVADDASPSPLVAQVMAELAAGDARIRFTRCEVNGNIAKATNAALALAEGAFVALMDHDDLLAETALYEVAVELAAHPDADLIFSDEDQIDDVGNRSMPYFKSAWNIDLMLGHNMVNHLGVYRRSLVERLGGMRAGFEGSQDYDLALWVANVSTPARIRHIPAVLYHWPPAQRFIFTKPGSRPVLRTHAGRLLIIWMRRAMPAAPGWVRHLAFPAGRG